MSIEWLILIGVLLVAGLATHSASRNSKRDYQTEHPLHDAKEARELGESSREKYYKGAFKDALRDVDEALLLEPDSHYLLWLRAAIHNSLGNQHLAIEDCEHILAKNDLYHWAYEQRGMAYLSLKHFADAKADFEQTIILEKNAPRAYFGLFAVAVEEKNEKEAQAYLKKFFALLPDKNAGLKQTLQAIYSMKVYNIVIVFVDEALKRDDIAEEDLLSYRAWSYYHLKKHSQALSDAERMFVLNPENNASLRLKAYSYKAMQDYEKAVTAFQTLYAKSPDNLTFASEYCNCLRYLRRYEEALPIVQALQAQKPDESAYVNLEGLIYLGANRFEDAVLAFTKAIELKADISVHYDNRSIVYRALKQFDKAWEDAKKALSLDPDSANLYCNRAALFLAEDKPEAALENVKKALDLDPNESYAYSIQARIYSYVEDYEPALIAIQTAREKAPFRGWRFNVMEAIIELARSNEQTAESLWQAAAQHEPRLWDEAWVLLEYDLSPKLIPFAQTLVNQKP